MSRSHKLLPKILIAIVVLGAILAIGAIDVGVLACVAVIAGLGTAMTWIAPRVVFRAEATWLVLVSVGLTLYTGAQCVPLPAAWIAQLSPHAADVWGHAFEPWHVSGPALTSLSVDTAGTRVEVLKGVVYTLVLLSTLRIAHKKDGVVFLERLLLVAAVLVGIVTLAHDAVDAKRVFGIYEPRTLIAIVGPLMNTNQLAGYLNIGLCIAFAAMIGREPFAPRALLFLVVVALIAGEVRLASRGAVLAMIVSIATCLALTLTTRRNASKGVSFALPTLLAGSGIAAIVFAGVDATRRGLVDADVSKLSTQWWALRSMTGAYALFGAGRGAFEATFQEFRRGTGHIVYTSPENVIVQWISEWGVPVAVVALLSILWTLRPSVLLSRSQPPIGPWTALMAVGLQNLVDFSLEIPGVVIALVVCAGIVVAGTSTSDRRTRTWERWGKYPRHVMFASAIVAALAIAVALPMRPHDLTDERLVLKSLSTDGAVSNDQFFDRLRAAISVHPAEPYFPYLGAARTWAFVPNGNVVTWVDRTLERAATYPPAHLLLARWLRTRSKSQALLEYRLAAEQDAAQIGKEAEALVTSFEDATELAPAGPVGVVVLESLSSSLGTRLPSTRARIDAEILRRHPAAGAPRLRTAQGALLDLADGEAAPWCFEAREQCAANALTVARDAEAHLDLCAPYVVEARIQVCLGVPVQGMDVLSRATDVVTDRAECLRALAELAIEQKDVTRATDAIEKLSNAACPTEGDCVANILTAAELEQRRGNRGRALLLFKRAADEVPDRDDLVERVAIQAQAAGLHAFAADSYAKLSMRHPENDAFAQAAKREAAAARELK